jgi:hypothetical protein
MSVDLYRDDLNAISGTDLFSAITAFCRISEPVEDRPQEDYRLDFKQEWKEEAIRVVASFANTFGGILFVGIADEKGKPKEIIGASSKSEMKTRIASSIASNISPTPAYDIAECAIPTDTTKKVCVIRVRRGTDLYLLTTKGESNPAYVRNADESRPARAAELRALIEQRSATTPQSNLARRLDEWQQFGVTTNGIRPNSPRLCSEAFLKIITLPTPPSKLVLDQALEEHVFRTVKLRYPGVHGFLPSAVELDEQRGRDSYELRWRHPGLDFERKWRVNSGGEFGFTTQLKYGLTESGDFWSLCDVALALIGTLAATGEWWEASGYFGDARLIAWLSVGGLPLYKLNRYPHGFAPLFYSRGMWPDKSKWPMKPINVPEYPFAEAETTLSPDVLTPTDPQNGSGCVAEADLNYSSLRARDEMANTTALVLNQFVRSLGHVANLRTLRASTEYLTGQLQIDR